MSTHIYTYSVSSEFEKMAVRALRVAMYASFAVIMLICAAVHGVEGHTPMQTDVSMRHDDGDARCAAVQAENSSQLKVVIVYDSRSGRTLEMANALARGCEASSAMASCGVVSVDVITWDGVRDAHALAVGSPTYYANPTAATLRFIEDVLGNAWQTGGFNGVPAAVFATGGGVNQGTESAIAALARGLNAFGVSLVTPRVTTSGYAATIGAAAITDTAPWNGESVADEFLKTAYDLGTLLADAAARAWTRRCSL